MKNNFFKNRFCFVLFIYLFFFLEKQVGQQRGEGYREKNLLKFSLKKKTCTSSLLLSVWLHPHVVKILFCSNHDPRG